MIVACPNCGRSVEQHDVPVRRPVNGSDELWLCLKCSCIVCSHPVFSGTETSVPCYIKHISEAHPWLYEPKARPTEGCKKNKKHKKK